VTQDPVVLVVVYYFPPWGGGPVFRTLKFTKYLDRLGWRVVVLTAHPRYYEPFAYDESLLGEIEPSVSVYRTHALLPGGAVTGALAAASAQHNGGGGLKSLGIRLVRALHALLIPDDKILWLPFAVARALRVILGQRVHVLFVSAPPHSSALVALALSTVAKRPFVVDFRDDWGGNPLYQRAHRLRSWLEQRLENLVLDRAAAVIVPTPESARRLRTRRNSVRNRVHVIPNGVDLEDVERAVARTRPGMQSSSTLSCIYAGLLNERRDISSLLHAMQRLPGAQPDAVRLQLAGFVPPAVLATIRELGLESRVELLGYLSHVDVLAAIMTADAAILLSTAAEGSATAVPSKLYEYVACGTYVLGLVDPGSTRDLIESNAWGSTCPPDDADAIQVALELLIRMKQEGRLARSDQAHGIVPTYSRRHHAEVLDALLRRVVVARSRPET
jgi:glycosyltransferase involved in cell wall biosynthesis